MNITTPTLVAMLRFPTQGIKHKGSYGKADFSDFGNVMEF
jgi:hypothetical protein